MNEAGNIPAKRTHKIRSFTDPSVKIFFYLPSKRKDEMEYGMMMVRNIADTWQKD